VIALNDQPDGLNINHGYDALEPKLLRETVLRERANFGAQFDATVTACLRRRTR